MNRNLSRISTAIVVILLLTVFVIGVSGKSDPASAIKQASASGEQFGGGEISVRTDSPMWMAATQPWTKEMMLAAEPYPLEINEGEPALSVELAEPLGKPGLIPSTAPEGTETFSMVEEDFEILSGAALLGYTYPPPYTRYRNFDSYDVFPYSTVGVIFFTQNGHNYRCSAASIGEDAIWTAGHCIHSGDGTLEGWSENLVFVPAYEDGNAPFGAWIANNLWTKGNWFNSADLSYDMGGAQLKKNGSGKMISQVVGNLGFSYNLNNDQHWFDFAYPSETPFDGKWQIICSGSFAYNDTSEGPPYPVAMGCDMTKGSSGGPWIRKFSGVAGSANYLNGNNSYRYTSHPEEMFSPYFGEGAKTLYEQLLGITHNNLPLISK